VSDALKESTFEKEIVEYLAQRGWLYSKNDAGYDRDRALFPDDVFAWLGDTQTDALAGLIKSDGPPDARERTRARILDALVSVLNAPMDHGGGTINVLHKGFRHISTHFSMCQAKPTETMNPKTVADYNANRLRVMRQVHYSKTHPQNSIDLVLFCNGIPVATIELKTEFKQSVTRGKVQYAKDRNPQKQAHAGLLGFGTRAVVHFVVTDRVLSMTTKLAGDETTWLPFNRGNHDRAGNPINSSGSDTEYFWTDILDRDTFLAILTKYVVVRTDERPDPVTGAMKKATSIRFPRFHQLTAVEKIVRHAYEHGVGRRYLVEHSAGSGKTDTIVWTAFRLAALHDVDNKKIFDSVIVISDRNVLDKQMKNAMRQLDPKGFQVASIGDGGGDSKSQEMSDALAERTPIIVVTIQTAPFALQYLRSAAVRHGGNYAVLADEAHSSQTGNAAAKLRIVLSPAERQAFDDGGEVDTEAILAAELDQKAATPNISYLAFTATPKSKTLELFGTPDANDLTEDGEPRPKPFHRYTMRQAIEEDFILDVLTNYTPYDLAYRVAVEGEEYDSKVDKAKARKAVMRWVKLHEHNISQKAALIVEHFRDNIAPMLGGTAKAMVVTSLRKEALRYHSALNHYISKQGYDDVHTLVAFSGKVVVAADDTDMKPDDLLPVGEYTEANVNTGTKGKPLADAFNGPDYQVMIAANKFQVGFDQPLLCAMYVDKRLDGVLAVQTLSRLNRTWPGKDRVYILDFVNEADTIKDAFLPYFEGARIEQLTDPNIPNRLAAKLDQTGLYAYSQIDKAVEATIKGDHGMLTGAISPTVHAYTDARNAARNDDNQEELQRLEVFRSDVGNYVKAYDFLSQMVAYGTEMEKRSIFYRALNQALTSDTSDIDINVSHIQMTHYRLTKREERPIDLAKGKPTPLTPLVEMGTNNAREPEGAQWSEILDAINSLFADSGLSDVDAIQQLEQTLRTVKSDAQLVARAKANTDADFNSDPSTMNSFIDAVLQGSKTNEIFTDAVLRDQNARTLVDLFRLIGLRSYLADEA
jgi:type I restriction enzyme, R subunit